MCCLVVLICYRYTKIPSAQLSVAKSYAPAPCPMLFELSEEREKSMTVDTDIDIDIDIDIRTGRLGLGKCGKGPTRNPSLVQ